MDTEALLDEWRRETRNGPVAKEARTRDGRLLNYHGRRLSRPASEVYERLMRMGSGLDDLWPLASIPMKTEGALAVGVQSGHGPIRYQLFAIEDQGRIEWRFTMERLQGRYEYAIVPAGKGTLVENVIDGSLSGDLVEVWPKAIGPLHDWVLERIFDRLDQPPAPWFDPKLVGAIR